VLNSLTGYFTSNTGNHADAASMARANIYQQLNQQAGAMAYQDIYRFLCWMAVLMVGFAFLLSKNKPGEGAPAGEGMH
jgi:DHA2 family multidrug resistance protein